jgi:hypothetical protein
MNGGDDGGNDDDGGGGGGDDDDDDDGDEVTETFGQRPSLRWYRESVVSYTAIVEKSRMI